jgi:Ca2+/Na+ antiporter
MIHFFLLCALWDFAAHFSQAHNAHLDNPPPSRHTSPRMPLAALDPSLRWGPAALLLGGLVALFACARMLATLLPRQDSHIGLRALAYFIPIAATALISMLLGRPEIAVGIVFGTSVAALTTVVGFIALSGPVGDGPPRYRRIWPFQLAAAVLVFVGGFKGTFSWREAVALATEGILLLSLWNDKNEWREASAQSVLEEASGSSPPIPTAIPLTYLPSRPRATAGEIFLTLLQLALIAVVLWLGAWAVTHGTVRTSQMLHGLATSAVASSIVSLALTLPMMYGTWRLAAGGRGCGPVTTQIGIVLLNVCGLLAILIVSPYAAAHLPQLTKWSGDAMVWHPGLPRLLLFPSPMWRIDNVILIIMGIFLLPVALGKWKLGREEGMVLIAGYFFYLTATIASGYEPGVSR